MMVYTCAAAEAVTEENTGVEKSNLQNPLAPRIRIASTAVTVNIVMSWDKIVSQDLLPLASGLKSNASKP